MTSAPEIEAMAHLELNRAFAIAKAELEIRWFGKQEPRDDGDGEAEPAP